MTRTRLQGYNCCADLDLQCQQAFSGGQLPFITKTPWYPNTALGKVLGLMTLMSDVLGCGSLALLLLERPQIFPNLLV
jgi:hypothetical protein